jgi:hypothetical protein
VEKVFTVSDVTQVELSSRGNRRKLYVGEPRHEGLVELLKNWLLVQLDEGVSNYLENNKNVR